MTRYRIIYLDAFTTEPFSGNPCAVLPEADGLTDDQMQKIACETNLSETAFVLPSEKAAVRVRYFMPYKEIPFAGHPTIATAFMLAQEGRVPGDGAISRVDFEFNIGRLPVEIQWDMNRRPVRVMMAQKTPTFGAVADPPDLIPSLGLRRQDILDSGPIQVVSTGVPFLLIPLTDMVSLRKAQMDRTRLLSVLKDLQVDAAYLFCPGGFDPETDFHGRLFSPGGVSEDPFTGSAVGAAGAYAVRHGILSGPELIVEQGHMVSRPGRGTVEILQSANQIVSVKVGGSAVRTLDGYILMK
jgi:trans-2,3-dihydro-3-hydroxyanthranilate isomerase